MPAQTPIKRSIYLHAMVLMIAATSLVVFSNFVVLRLAFPFYFNNFFTLNLERALSMALTDPAAQQDASILKSRLMVSVADMQSEEIMVALVKSDAMPPDFFSNTTWKNINASLDSRSQSSNINFQQSNWLAVKVPTPQGFSYAAISNAATVRTADRIASARLELLAVQMPSIGVIVILLSLLFAYFLIWPIKKLTAQFQVFMQSSKQDQLVLIDPKPNYREFSLLINYVNDLLQRLQKSRLQASRFSSDASHELRTPLTIVRGHLNQALHLAHDGSALQIKLAVVIQEVERVISISDKLLQLALADSGRMQLHYSQVNLSDLLGELVEDTKTGSSQLRIHADLKSKVLMQCDPQLIWQLLTNLMGNAIKFNRPQGWIELSLRQTGDQVFLTFANSSGQDTSKMDHRVFERFFRYSHFESTAANQTIEGFGLGLSLCREIVLAHQGDIQWEPRPNQSVLISVVLPVRPR